MSDNQFYVLITVIGTGLAAIGAAIRFSVGIITKALNTNSEAMLRNTESNAVLATHIQIVTGYVTSRSKLPSDVKDFIREEISGVHDSIPEDPPSRPRVKTDPRGHKAGQYGIKRPGTKGDGE